MTAQDRARWDDRYRAATPALEDPALPEVFAPNAELFPAAGLAIEIACGTGRAAVWLAVRGLRVRGYDVSPVAIDLARQRATAAGVSERCTFEAADLDDGLPPGDLGGRVDVVLCHLFRDPSLDRALAERLVPGGLLAMAALSEVGAEPGRFRCAPGELRRDIAALGLIEVIAAGEGDGVAWVLGRRVVDTLGPGAESE